MAFIGNQPTAVPLTSDQLTDGLITSAKIADGAVVNVDVNSTAAIAYSKLNLATSIVNGDIANATIALAKLSATGTPSATTFLRGDNSWASPVGGKVLQVVNMTTQTDTSTNTGAFVATASTLAITPSSASSKILILATGNVNNTSTNEWTYVTIARDGTNLGSSVQGMVGVYSNGGDIHAPSTMVYLDSPNSTSSLTYDVRISVSGGTGKWNQQLAKASLTLIEIAG